jgi:hypothetical protein
MHDTGSSVPRRARKALYEQGDGLGVAATGQNVAVEDEGSIATEHQLRTVAKLELPEAGKIRAQVFIAPNRF